MILTRRTLIELGVCAAASACGPWRASLAQSDDLLKRAIPSSGERVTAIGIGTNRYSVGGSEAELAPLRATLARFHALGGQLIDTAEEYGRSEHTIGALTEALGVNDDLFIASKVRMRGRQAGRRSIEQSFGRLRRTQLDLMQVHDLTDFSTQIETLYTLKAQGRIRYIGMTASRDNRAAELERLMRAADVDFVQLSYSLDNRGAAERLLPLALDRGIGVLVNRPFGSGRLFGRIRGRALPEWAAELDCASWGQFFLKYIVSHPAVTCAIPGTRREEHVIDNLGAVAGRLPDARLRARQEQFFDALV